MKAKHSVSIVWSREDEAYIATVPELPGCAADGTTQEEALKNIQKIALEWIETAREEKRNIPEPLTLEDYENRARDSQRELRKRKSEFTKTVEKLVAGIHETASVHVLSLPAKLSSPGEVHSRKASKVLATEDESR